MNYYKRHLGDYAKNTRTLSTYEHGVYNLLLDLYYTDEGPISSADAYDICRASNATEKASVNKVLAKFFEPDGDLFRHSRADEEIANYREKSDKNKKIGALGGKQKAKRMASETLSESVGDEVANDTPSHKPLAISEKQEQEQQQEQAPKADASPSAPPTENARGTRLPSDWELPADWRAWAVDERPEVNPDREAAMFADYWLSLPASKARRADWKRTWRNWIRNARTNHDRGTQSRKLSAVERVHENARRAVSATVTPIDGECRVVRLGADG